MKVRPHPNIHECCMDTLRANTGTWEEGDRLICRGCDTEYKMQGGIWNVQEKGSY